MVFSTCSDPNRYQFTWDKLFFNSHKAVREVFKLKLYYYKAVTMLNTGTYEGRLYILLFKIVRVVGPAIGCLRSLI